MVEMNVEASQGACNERHLEFDRQATRSSKIKELAIGSEVTEHDQP